jgi:hypothetical protein
MKVINFDYDTIIFFKDFLKKNPKFNDDIGSALSDI